MTKAYHSVSKVKIIYVLTTLFLVGLSVFCFIQIYRLLNSSNQIYFNSQVKDGLRNISTALYKAESSKQGFLLTGDSLILQRRNQALKALEQDLHVLEGLMEDHPLQSIHFNLLKIAIQKEVMSLNSIPDINGIQVVDERLKVNILEGQTDMDVVNLYLHGMLEEEGDVFKQRGLLFLRLSNIIPWFVIFLFLGAILILFFSYFKLNMELKKSKLLHSALLHQDFEREALANQLITVNKELAYENIEKEKRASELVVANIALALQNENKEKLANELVIANIELEHQNQEKERRTAELLHANKELELFVNISSHDLQEPLRKIQMSASRIEEDDYNRLSDKARDHFIRMQSAARSMQNLIEDLLAYSRTNKEERNFEITDLESIVEEVKNELREIIEEKQANIIMLANCEASIIPFQFRQLMFNILANSLKFSIPGLPPHIVISAVLKPGSQIDQVAINHSLEYCHIRISDNGIGFDPQYSEVIFEVFQRLHSKDIYKGSGIGLAIVKKIVENHDGVISASGRLNGGAVFNIFIPNINVAQHGQYSITNYSGR